jgi:hypothetical protein
VASTKEVDFLRMQVQSLQAQLSAAVQHQEAIILGLVNLLGKQPQQQPDLGMMAMAPILLALLNPEKEAQMPEGLSRQLRDLLISRQPAAPKPGKPSARQASKKEQRSER